MAPPSSQPPPRDGARAAALRAWALPGIAVAAVVLGLGWLVFDRTASPLPEWVATAVIVLGLFVLWGHPVGRRARERLNELAERVPKGVRRAVPLGVVVAIAAWALWPLPLGEPPIGQDHAYHYFATDILVHDLLPEGRLFGWTDRFSAGRPFGDSYATAAYLATGLVHLITFGAVPLEASYGLGIFFAWLVGALAIGTWAARLSVSSEPGGRTAWIAPIFAGALYVLDPGGDRQGGWIYAMFHGVWPQVLSTGLWALGLLCFVRLVERQTVARLGLAVLVSVAALWTHPVGVPNFLVAGPLLALVLAAWRLRASDTESARTGPSAEPRRGLLWVVIGLGLAAVAGMGWFSHLLHAANEEFVAEHYTRWGVMREIVLGAIEGEPFANQWAVGAVAALLGLVVALRRARWEHVFVVALLVAFMVVGSSEPLLAFDLGVHPEHKPLMYNRFSISMKPFWYALAGVGAAAAVDAVRALPLSKSGSSVSLRVVSLVVIGPLLWAAWQALPGLIPSPAARPLTAEAAGTRLTTVLPEMRRLFDAEAQRLEGKPKRAVLWEEGREQGAYELLPLAQAGFGFLPTRNPPTHTYRYGNEARQPEGFRFLGASLVVADRPLDWAGTELGRFGRHYVYRLQEDPGWPVRLEGPGEVRVDEWTAGERVLALSGTSQETRVILGQAPYDKWHAIQDGERRPVLDYHGMKGYQLAFVPGVTDGRLVLRYRDTPRERVFEVAAAVIVGLGLLALFGWRLALPRLARGRGLQALSAGVLGLIVVGALALWVLAMVWQDEALENRWLHDDPSGTQILAVMHQRLPDVVRFSPESRCVQPYTRRYSTECNENELRPELHASRVIHHRRGRGIDPVPPKARVELPSCLRFGVPGQGHVRLEYDVPAGARHLEGRLVSLNRQRARGYLRVGSRKQRVSTDGSRFRVELPQGADRIALDLSSRNRGTVFACMELVAVEP